MTGSHLQNTPAPSDYELMHDLSLSVQVLLVLGSFISLALVVAMGVNALPGILS